MKQETGSIGEADHERLCAYLFGELEEGARGAFEEELAGSPALQAELERMRSTVQLVKAAVPATEAGLSQESIANLVEARSGEGAGLTAGELGRPARSRLRLLPGGTVTRVAAGLVLFLGAGLLLRGYLLPLPAPEDAGPSTYSTFGTSEVARLEVSEPPAGASGDPSLAEVVGLGGGVKEPSPANRFGGREGAAGKFHSQAPGNTDSLSRGPASLGPGSLGPGSLGPGSLGPASPGSGIALFREGGGPAGPNIKQRARAQEDVLERVARRGLPHTVQGAAGAVTEDRRAEERESLEALKALGYVEEDAEGGAVASPVSRLDALTRRLVLGCRLQPEETPREMFHRCWGEHPFVPVTAEDHLSTFSVDVDTASYVQSRHALLAGRLPAAGAVRTEEFVNYFSPDKDAPVGGETFAVDLEMAPSRFSGDVRTNLLRVTVRARDVEDYERQPLALTFVVDVSGSMRQQDRLVNVKEALSLLVRKLDAGDSVALVAFNKEARVVAPMMSAAARGSLENALYQLSAGGGTSVEQGLRIGFETAVDQLRPGAVNRVIFLSDGVGNIDETDQERILASVEEYRDKKVYLNTIGVGLDSHNDHFLEQLADRGDGVCNYIDTLAEAKKVMVDDFTRTLQPIARDVKIQVDFDPSQVERYRQLGYENRALRDDQFRDDTVDAGEVNAGHQVTALYEIVPRPGSAGEFITARVRFKPPYAVDRGQTSEVAAEDAEQALEIEARLSWSRIAPSFGAASSGYRRAVLVAQFAELLRRSLYARGESVDELIGELERLQAQGALDTRAAGELDELLGLVRRARPELMRLEEAHRARPAWQATVDEIRRLNYRIAQSELLGTESAAERARDEARRDELEEQLMGILREGSEKDGPELVGEIESYLGRGGDLPLEELMRLRATGYAGDPREDSVKESPRSRR